VAKEGSRHRIFLTRIKFQTKEKTMLQSKKGRALIGLTAILFFIAIAFYTTARAQVVNADEIIKMVNDWKAINLKYGQWIHVVSAITSETPNGVILPDGQPMPSSYIQDDWFYIIDVHKNWLRYVTLRERSLRPKSLVFWRRGPSLRSGRH
jgi:hypothetical protein